MKLNDRLPGETAKSYASREITENIISLELKPGSLVSENDLARTLGISRTPVREAIHELVTAQLIEVVPQKGSYVSRISFDVIEEAAFLRRVLEVAIVEELCDNATEEDIAVLIENVRLQEYYLNNKIPSKIMELDNEFHYSLFCMSHKERIYGLMQSMMGHFDRVRALSLYAVKDNKIVSDHRGIVTAISNRDKEEAKAIMMKHLMRYQLDKDEVEQMYPDYFEGPK